jgi:long-chain fatty acid transport protein
MKYGSISTIVLIFLLHQSIMAGGLDYNTTFGTRTFSLNGLYFAGSPGLASISSNPAGLISLNGRGLELSVMNRIEQNEFNSPSRGLYRSFNNDKYTFGGGLYWQFSENFTAGASYHPVIDYKADWPFAVLRQTDTSASILAFSMMNRLQIMSISPAVSFRLGSLTIGIAGNVYQVIHQMSFPMNNEGWGQNTGLAAYQLGYDLNSWAFGGTIGFLYDLNETFRFGFTAKSGAKTELTGTAESRFFSDLLNAPSLTDVSADLEIPWKFGGGLLYTLNESTFLNIDAAYSLWGNTISSLDLIFANSEWQNRAASADSLSGFAPGSIPLKFNNSFDLGLGIEHLTSGGMAYRAGYRFSQSSNSSASYSYLLPMTDQHIIVIGIGYNDENLTIDAGLAYTFGITREVSPSENRFLYGEYFTDSYIPSVTIRYGF